MYVYTTRDELREQAYNDWSYMNEWRCYATKDMINWTDMGQIAHAQTFNKESSSAKENWRAWAQQVVSMPIKQDDGTWVTKYFLFAPFNGTKIDVAVADNPWGPFEDATPGTYLIDGGWEGGNIDPTVFIEDHGNPDDYENYDVYLYWGNPYLRYCKLTNDLLDVDPDTDGDGELSEEENAIDPRFSASDNKILGKVRPGLHSCQTYGEEGYASFGEPSQGKATKGKFPTEPKGSEQKRSAFEEGPWLMKHDDGNPETDDYFMFFVGGRTPGETVEYSTAPTPLGPWTYRALLMDRENGYSCIHPGVAEFKGHNYLFYLNEMLVGGTGSNRSVCVKEFTYDENNLIVKETDDSTTAYMKQGMPSTTKGTSYFSVDPIGTLNPYILNQAETICWESNLNGPNGGFNGTGAGVKTKAKEPCTDIDEVTGKEAFWKSAALNGVVVSDIDNDDFIKVREVNFGEEEILSFKVSAACGDGTDLDDPKYDKNGIQIFNPEETTVGGNIEVWIDYDTENETHIGTLPITNTGGTNEYKEFSMPVTEPITGVHDLTFIFTGATDAKLFNFDTWQFVAKEVPVSTPEPTPIPTPAQETAAPTLSPAAPANTSTPAPVITQSPAGPAITAAPEQPAIKLSAPTIKSLKASAGKVKITYSKVKNASGYAIYMAKSKKGKFTKKLEVNSAKTKATVKKLKKGKTFYFKLRAYHITNGKKIYSKYSKVKKVKVK